MNPETFEAKQFPNKMEANAAGFTVPLTAKEFWDFPEMNRKQRRDLLKSKRKSGYMASPKSKGSK